MYVPINRPQWMENKMIWVLFSVYGWINDMLSCIYAIFRPWWTENSAQIILLFRPLWTENSIYAYNLSIHYYYYYYTRLTALCPGLPGWASTRKVKLIWILLKQETVSGSGISWAICKSAPRLRQITTPAPHHSVFCRPDALPAAQPTASKHWRKQFIHPHVQKTATNCYIG